MAVKTQAAQKYKLITEDTNVSVLNARGTNPNTPVIARLINNSVLSLEDRGGVMKWLEYQRSVCLQASR